MDAQKHSPIITWTPEMSVGVSELDADHRILVGLINKLSDAQDVNDAAVIESVLDSLAIYVDEHFQREEAYMESVGCLHLQEHRQKHRALTAQVEQIRLDFFLGNRDCLGEHTLAFLKEWLRQHILIEDMQYNPDHRLLK
jgi:hemerythrin